MNNQENVEEVKSYLSEEEKASAIKATRSNDLRLILGALFSIYGVIVMIVGFVDHSAHNQATNGFMVNFWTGLCMLIAGLLFLAWNYIRPIPEADIIESAEASARLAAQQKAEV